jgi:putative peptidoglycan lipid II flippase
MVSKVLSFLYKESGSLNQAALLLGFFALLSQILAFLRDRLLAHVFGAGGDLDIYYAAFRVPDFLFITVASVVSLSVLIPFIVEKDTEDFQEENKDRKILRSFIDSIFTLFMVLILGSTLICFIFMPQISEWLFKGLPEESLERVITLSRLLLISPIILGLSNLFGSLTQAYNRFTTYAISPLLYNTGIILGIILFGESMGIKGVVVGVIAGVFLHALIQLPFIFKEGILPRISWHPDLESLKKVVKISFPRTLTLSMSSIALVALISFAARMPEGSISILSFSFSLQSLPMALIGVPYSLAAFPILSRKFQEKNLSAFMEQMQNTTRFIIFWSLPLTALLVVLRAQIVRVLLGTGLFDWPATRLTAAALALFALSALFQSLILLFMRGFYSAGMTKRPFYINLFATVFLLGSTYFLVNIFNQSETFRYFITSLLKVEDVEGSRVLMLSLGFTIGTIINCVILWLDFEKAFKGFSKGVLRSLFEGVGTGVIMGAVAYWGLNIFDTTFDINTLPGIFLQGFLAGILAIGVGIGLLLTLRSRELISVWAALKGKFRPGKVIATDPEIV